MTHSATIIEMGQKYLMQNYRPLPVVVERGEGARLIDTEGHSYIDFAAGVAVSSLGYGHKALAEAIKAQVDKILHTSNGVYNEPSVLLAKALCEHSFADRVFFANSGAEANEAMLKLARRAFAKQDPQRCEIICMDRAFHGRTLGTISSTGQLKYQEGFGPLLPGFHAVPFGDIEAVKAKMTKNISAIIVEPILGEGGLVISPQGFLKALRDLCDEWGALLMFDEVQTGMGRTGKLFAYMHDDVIPDAMALAKGLGGGMPIGALLCSEKWANVLEFPSHGSTFGGNPVTCAAGLAVMQHMTRPDFLPEVARLGEHLRERLSRFKDGRGRGLFFGLPCNFDTISFRKDALARGLLLNFCGHQVLRIAPPLVIDELTLDQGLDILTELLVQYEHG